VKTGHPRLCFDSHEARSIGSLDPGKSPTRTIRGRVGRPLLIHLLTDKAFNANHFHQRGYSATGVGAAPVSNPTFYCPSRDGSIKAVTIHTTMSTVLPSMPPRRTIRQPPCPSFLGLGIICYSLTPSVTSRPSLERRRSTEEQCSYVEHRESHARHRTQGLSPSCHQRHHDTPGMVDIHRCTSLQ
jgi:hypothetical protein